MAAHLRFVKSAITQRSGGTYRAANLSQHPELAQGLCGGWRAYAAATAEDDERIAKLTAQAQETKTKTDQLAVAEINSSVTLKGFDNAATNDHVASASVPRQSGCEILMPSGKLRASPLDKPLSADGPVPETVKPGPWKSLAGEPAEAAE